MKKDFGEPNPQDYQVVYDGEVESNSLEAIYFNHPTGYTGRSPSMMDKQEWGATPLLFIKLLRIKCSVH